MPETKRQDARVKATLAVNVEGRAAGTTRDVSAGGIFFETDEQMADGSPVAFTVEFDGPAGKFVLRCTGRVVRVERSGTRVGVAAKILESKLELKSETAGEKAAASRQDGALDALTVSR